MPTTSLSATTDTHVVVEDVDLLRLSADLVRAAWEPDPDAAVDAHLVQVVALAAKAIVGADGASVSLVRAGRTKTVAASNDTVMRMDDHQYATGEGPCLAAAADGIPFAIESLADDDRWPAFVPLAVAEGIASILSTPLVTDVGPIGALNLYSTSPGAFGPDERDLAAAFATHASQIAVGSQATISDDELDARIGAALQSRTTLALAQGILMERHNLTADEAAAVLHRAARGAGTSALHAASDVVASSEQDGPRGVTGRARRD